MIEELENYAKVNHVPIMLPDGIDYLTNYIKENNVKNILEIGTAIGYSSIRMALIDKDIKITTIERNRDLYLEAIKNVQKFNLQDQINIIEADALDVEINGEFDLIFIDAAKSQYINFFNKFSPLLNKNGTIISDNLLFHGFVNQDEIKSRNLRQLVRKINNYIDFLENNPDFETTFLEIGDGLGVTKPKKYKFDN